MLPAGARLGPYEVIAPLGAGGMGVVYKARDSRLDRVVALKVISPLLSGSPELRQRFEREARTISQLTHPNICALYDVGEVRPERAPAAKEPVSFLVLEYCEGHTLAERILRGPLPIEQVVRIAIDICNALHRAHAAGIIHRDLKPANVMLTPGGAKLLDFGLARPAALAAGGPAAGSTVQTPLTDRGTILGTFQYMSPEQIEGDEADARSDIWALGCVIYEMITARRAFAGKSQSTVIAAILEREPPPIVSSQPLVPPIFDALVRGCLAKSPADRIQSAHDISLHLRWIAGSESGSMQSGAIAAARPRPRARWLSAAVGALILALAYPAVRYFTAAPPAPARAVVLSVPPPEAHVFVPTDGFSLAPDGSALAFTATGENGERTLWIRRFDSLAPVKVAAPRNAQTPFWSPDGGSLGIFAADYLQVLNLATGTVRTLTAARPASAAWGSTGLIAFSVEGEGIQIIGADGSGRRALTKVDQGAGESGHMGPIFVPDGEHVLFTMVPAANQSKRAAPEIRVVSIATGVTRSLGLAGRSAGYDIGEAMVVTPAGALQAQAMDPRTVMPTGPARLVRQSDQYTPATEIRLTASGSGAVAFRGGTSGVKHRLTWFDRSGKQLGVVGDVDNYSNPAISRDGGHLAVSIRPARSDARDIWIFDLARPTPTRLTHDNGDDSSPLWSPDGSRVVFSSDRSGVRDLYAKLASGLGPDELLLKSEANKSALDWSPDGRQLFFGVFRGQQTDVDRLNLADGTVSRVLDGPYDEGNVALSPDGSLMAYVSNESGKTEVFVRTFPGTEAKWQVSTGGGGEPSWRRDGQELFYVTDDEVMSVPITKRGTRVDPQPANRLFRQRLGAVLRNRYVVAPDGQRFLLNVPAIDRTLEPITVILNWRQLPQ